MLLGLDRNGPLCSGIAVQPYSHSFRTLSRRRKNAAWFSLRLHKLSGQKPLRLARAVMMRPTPTVSPRHYPNNASLCNVNGLKQLGRGHGSDWLKMPQSALLAHFIIKLSRVRARRLLGRPRAIQSGDRPGQPSRRAGNGKQGKRREEQNCRETTRESASDGAKRWAESLKGFSRRRSEPTEANARHG